jgi:hypothetical protein
MSASDPQSYGTPDVYRQFIAETLAGAEIHARIGQNYAEIGNDPGLDYAIRCLVANTRAAVSVLANLKEMNATLARRRAEATAPVTPAEATEARP